MNAIWTPVDYLASLFLRAPGLSMFVMLGLGFAPLCIMMFVRTERLRKISWRVGIVSITTAGVFAWLIMGLLNPTFIGASYIQRADDLCVGNTLMVGVDTLKIPDPDGDTGETFRLHGFDLEQKTRTFRRLFRYPIELLGIKNDIVWIGQRQSWYGIDMRDGTTRFTVNAQAIIKQHPELHVGIDRLEVRAEQFIVTVFAKDGHIYLFDLETLQPPSNTSTNTLTSCGHTVASSLRLTNEVRATLQDADGQSILPERTFLHGTILAGDRIRNITLIRSFTRTDERESILSGVVDAQHIWQKTPAQLGAVSRTSLVDPPLTHAFFDQNQAIVLIGGTILGVDPTNGNVMWKSLW